MKGATKSRPTIELDGHRIPTHQVSLKSPIDPSRFIPIIPAAGRGARSIQAIRRGDLLPKTTSAAAIAAFNNFGYTLVDVFSPIYGSHHPLGRPAFLFRYSRMHDAYGHFWNMGLLPLETDTQVFRFQKLPNIQGNYLKVNLGQTANGDGSNGAILRVRVNTTQFNLDLSTRSFQYFDLVLPDSVSRHEVEFTLSSAINGGRGVSSGILGIELFETLRVFPDPTAFA